MIRAAQWWAIANGDRSSVGSVTAASRSKWPAERPEAKSLKAFAGNRFRCSRSPPLRTADGGGPVSFAQIYRNAPWGSTDGHCESVFFARCRRGHSDSATSAHLAALFPGVPWCRRPGRSASQSDRAATQWGATAPMGQFASVGRSMLCKVNEVFAVSSAEGAESTRRRRAKDVSQIGDRREQPGFAVLGACQQLIRRVVADKCVVLGVKVECMAGSPGGIA